MAFPDVPGTGAVFSPETAALLERGRASALAALSVFTAIRDAWRALGDTLRQSRELRGWWQEHERQHGGDQGRD